MKFLFRSILFCGTERRPKKRLVFYTYALLLLFVCVLQIHAHGASISRVAVLGTFLLLLTWAAQRRHFSTAPYTRPGKWRLLWLGICLILGGYLFYAIPVQGPPPLVRIEIGTTSQQNALSNGNEVWIVGIRSPRGKNAVLPHDFQSEERGEWNYGSNTVCSWRHQTSKLIWKGRISKNSTLEMIRSPWSGVVEVSVNGRRKRIDLYAAQNHQAAVLCFEEDTEVSMFTVIYLLSHILVLGGTLFYLSCWVLVHPGIAKINQVRWYWAVLFSIPPLLCWLLVLSEYQTGVLTNDSFDQWGQMLRGKFNDHHPVFHTLFNWLCTRIWFHPACVALVQVVCMAGSAGVFLYRQVLKGMHRVTAMISSIVFAILPANVFMVTTLWKDVAYSICMLLVTMCLFEVAASKGGWLSKMRNGIVLGVPCALCALFRHNGLPVMVGVLFFLCILCYRHWRTLLITIVLFFAIVHSVRGPLYRALDVDDSVAIRKSKLTNICFPFVMAHAMCGTEFSDDEKEVLSDVYAGDWCVPYSEHAIRKIRGSREFSREVLYGRRSKDINAMCQDLLKRNPRVHLYHFLRGSEYIWSVLPQQSSRYELFSSWISGGEVQYYRLSADSIVSRTVEKEKVSRSMPAIRWLHIMASRYDWFASRTALFLYMVTFLSICATIRSGSALWLLLALPVLLHTVLVVVAISYASNFRYQYPVMLTGLLTIPFLAVYVPRRKRID